MLTVGGVQQGAVSSPTNRRRDAGGVTSSFANRRLAVLYLSVCWLRLGKARLGMAFLGGTRLRALVFLLVLCSVRTLLPAQQLDGRSVMLRRDAPLLSRVRRASAVPDASPRTEGNCNQSVALDILGNETHRGIFDQSAELSLVWVGDGTGVILLLTTFRIPLIIISYGQSKLYRSENYGKSFEDITSHIKNTYIRTEFGMGLGPENSGRVVLVADVSGGSTGGRIFRSSDFAKTFVQTDLPFHPLRPISYNPDNPYCLMLISIHYELWISKDFGETWTMIHKSVCSSKWGPRNMILLTATTSNETCSDWSGLASSLTMKRTSDFGKTFKVLKEHVHSFGLWGQFLLASVMEEDRVKRRIHVSRDQGDTWNVAQLPSVTHEQFYSVLAASDDMVFIHVDDEGDTGCGTIYTSDDRGIVYSKSLERHLYTKTGGETDFTNVTSLRGVYITSVLSKDNSIYSVITFDQGGEWSRLNKPENADCDSTAKDKAKAVSEMLCLSLDRVCTSQMMVVIRGPGCWMVLTIMQFWILEDLLWQYNKAMICLSTPSSEDKDYITWLAHSTDPGATSDGCVLGYKEHYQRLRKLSMCQNGRDYLVSRESVNCVCTLDDYMCDFGYFRKENESTCEEQPELRGHELDLCINGEEEKLNTNGYRKIPGDKCTGGINPVREEVDLKKKCTNDLSESSPKPQENKPTSSSVPLILSVVVVLLVAVAAAIMIIKKYVCGGRFLVHRYSVLRQHADTHGDERLDTNIGEPGRRNGYHDDSDEDLLE
ncbi:hypothetical protein GDO81_006276 [Engystomops pustulosus]|uniref:VPS10 domain-containing protein n=1 Tax=Engystomops pustulosus TaxID=76066 RepID=A0AAV7CVM1_ENGPU|nr:hypothetical protein GDO81_006276 [Engystomops pustulosus]